MIRGLHGPSSDLVRTISGRSASSVVDRPQPRVPDGGLPRERVPERLPRRLERVPRVRRQRVVPLDACWQSAAHRQPGSAGREGKFGPERGIHRYRCRQGRSRQLRALHKRQEGAQRSRPAELSHSEPRPATARYMAALSRARTAPVAPPLPRSLLAGYHGPVERHLGGSGPRTGSRGPPGTRPDRNAPVPGCHLEDRCILPAGPGRTPRRPGPVPRLGGRGDPGPERQRLSFRPSLRRQDLAHGPHGSRCRHRLPCAQWTESRTRPVLLSGAPDTRSAT